MLDIRLIREDPQSVKNGLTAKGVAIDVDVLLDMDKRRRSLLTELDALRARKNTANTEIGRLIQNGQDPQPVIRDMKGISAQAAQMEPEIKKLETVIEEYMLAIPNLAHPSVPVGKPDQNRIVRSWGEAIPVQDGKDHVELAESLDLIDFKRAAKISGSHFILLKGAGARLERALINFMLDVHTREHGYREIFPPFLVNTAAMTGTGQLPKMAEDMYKLSDDELYLIPTAEVPVTNIHRDETLTAADLPVTYTAYTACFRREAGSYGKETRGLIRVHQFNKVELVRFVHPENSYEHLELLVTHAEKILQLLELPYRVVLLASGDLSFAAAKCYDLEVYAAGAQSWLEVSSCSNFEDFQARRANIRFKDKDGTRYVHTLNGSGMALARTMVAVLEHYQTPDGDVIIPEVLRPYMDEKTHISQL